MQRRSFLTGAAGLCAAALGGCSTTGSAQRAASARLAKAPAHVAAMYAAAPHERFPLPAVDIGKVPSRFWRRRVRYVSGYKPGTVVVDTKSFHLFLVEPDGRAMRYGVGLGRAGFAWAGDGVIQWKRPWPTWTPPEEMIERDPSLARWSASNGGMPPGLDNPLGARALYIFHNGEDTLYRVHGTPENDSIGRAVSSGCVRMINQDVVDLFRRVKNGAPIAVV